MADLDLRGVARAVERTVSPPDFIEVAARGHTIRRHRQRRRVAVTLVAAAAVGVAVVLPWQRLAPSDDPEPVAPPTQTDSQRTTLLLSDASAVVDDEALRVSDQGATLLRVSRPSPVGGECTADAESALVWQSWDGATRAWSASVSGREVAAAPGGFVVGAVVGPCVGPLGADAPERGAYVVDNDGAQRDVSWEGDAAEVCAVDPSDARCLVEVSTATGRLVDGGRAVPGPGYLAVARDGQDLWAASEDQTRLARSEDNGRSWRTHRTALTPENGDFLQATATGDVAIFFTWPRVEVTVDGGASWQVRDLEQALAPVRVANPILSVTADGDLLGVSYPTTSRPFLFASTDSTWRSFERSDFRTDGGDYHVATAGPFAYAVDVDSSWISSDGLAWERIEPRAVPDSR